MVQSKLLTAGLVAGALVLAPASSALAGGQRWSHGGGSYHAPAYHGGYHGGYHGSYYGHGGGG